MRSNPKSKSSSGTRPGPNPAATAMAPDEPVDPEPHAQAAPPKSSSSQEDWSDPAKQHQMSAIWPLLWLAIPFVALVLYGLFTTR